MAQSTCDFIVVGSGPAGSAVAASLAKAPRKPSVLLIEAGGTNEGRDLRVDGQRWTTFLKKDMNYSYRTCPQKHANARQLDYSRGKGLGGSSAINFGVYTVGPRDDYEQWARLVQDDAYRWENVKARFRKLECFHGSLPDGVDAKYAAPQAGDHGSSGDLHVGYASDWDKDIPVMLDLAEKAGFPLNGDHNSGNPLGISVSINSSHGGLRSTASDLLSPRPENLTILTGFRVQRVILEGLKAVGVESGARRYFASTEVILSAGALDTPRILMHSGIGPQGQLEQWGLPVIKDCPGIGQGLRDHMFAPIVHKRQENNTEKASFYSDSKAMTDALEQWRRDGTGPWAKFGCELCIGWFKLDRLVQSEEYEALPIDEQRHLNEETVPHYEMLTHFPAHWFFPELALTRVSYSCILVFYLNAQSLGEVTLQSADPDEPLKFDPKLLSSPFDRRAAIESLRDASRLFDSGGFGDGDVEMLRGPSGDTDEDLLAHWRSNIQSSWHMTGTTRMGKRDDATAVVDSDFKLFGVEKLRIVDMAVVPILPNCHVQSVAYMTGLTAAEKLIAEYDLD